MICFGHVGIIIRPVSQLFNLDCFYTFNLCQDDCVEVKDVRLPQLLQRAMAAEAEASREARAKVIDTGRGRAKVGEGPQGGLRYHQ
jgi:hypothetical protein